MARYINEGFAKPDDPIYREGWSIHIGPLLGTEPPSKKPEPQRTAKTDKQDERKRPSRRRS